MVPLTVMQIPHPRLKHTVSQLGTSSSEARNQHTHLIDNPLTRMQPPCEALQDRAELLQCMFERTRRAHTAARTSRMARSATALRWMPASAARTSP